MKESNKFTDEELKLLIQLHDLYTLKEIKNKLQEKLGVNKSIEDVRHTCNIHFIKFLTEEEMINSVKARMDNLVTTHRHWRISGSDNFNLALFDSDYFTLKNRLKAVGVEYDSRIT